jgi:hypothetical protein
MAKADRILGNFPWFYRAAEPTKLLGQVARLLAAPLEEADTHLLRIQRSHRLSVAEHAGDIVRLAAALNLSAFHFEDILADPLLTYEKKLELMRARVQRVARVHLKGLGTPRAVMEAAAIFLNAELVPETPGADPIRHLDADLTSHEATLEFTALPDRPRETIYLHENPYRRNKVEPAERWHLDAWAVENRNVERAPLRLLVRGVGEGTVLPSVFSPTAGEGLVFNGVVPDGMTLVIDPYEGATLEGLPVEEWLTYFRGDTFDYGVVEEGAFVEEEGGQSPTPFDGDVANAVARPFRRRLPVPSAPTGISEWRFKVADGVFDVNDFDFAVYEPPAEPVGVYDEDFDFDASVFDYPAAGVVGVGWDEAIPCSFKLLLPSHIPQAAPPADGARQQRPAPPVNYLNRVGAVMPRFKAAGIRFFLDSAKDVWTLGASVLRSAQAVEGEGVEYHSTLLRHPRADMLVPLDSTPS